MAISEPVAEIYAQIRRDFGAVLDPLQRLAARVGARLRSWRSSPSRSTPTSKAAKISPLLKTGGFALAFKALEAGTAVIAWYQVPPGVKLAKKTKARRSLWRLAC